MSSLCELIPWAGRPAVLITRHKVRSLVGPRPPCRVSWPFNPLELLLSHLLLLVVIIRVGASSFCGPWRPECHRRMVSCFTSLQHFGCAPTANRTSVERNGWPIIRVFTTFRISR